MYIESARPRISNLPEPAKTSQHTTGPSQKPQELDYLQLEIGGSIRNEQSEIGSKSPQVSNKGGGNWDHSIIQCKDSDVFRAFSGRDTGGLEEVVLVLPSKLTVLYSKLPSFCFFISPEFQFPTQVFVVSD